ncbi:MAG: O-antigen ligase family protein [Bacilli bacterium]
MIRLADTFQHFLNKKGINAFSQLFHKFVETDLFLLFYFVICLLNWKFHLVYLATIIGIILIFLIIVFNENRFRIVPVILFFVTSLRLNQPNDYLWPAIIASIVIFPLILFDLFKKSLKLNNQILIGMFFLLIAMVFSIINSPNLIMPILGILMMIVYILIFLYFFNKKQDYEQDRIWLYIAKSFTYFGMLILLETILYNFEVATSSNFLSFFNWKAINLSWANTNYIAMLYLTIIPLTAYWYSKTQKHFYLIIVMLVELLALILMISRGAYLAILISGLPFLVVFIMDIKNKIAITQKTLILINLFLILMLIVAIPTGIVKSFFDVLNSRGLSLSGRELLYRVGLSVFQRYPLFGGGIYTSEYYLSLVSTSVYYHNFIIHTLATMGIFGMVAFGFYLFQIYRQSLLKCSYNTYIFFIVLGISVHGLFDTAFYNPLIMVVLSIILPPMLDKSTLNELSRKELTNVYNKN